MSFTHSASQNITTPAGTLTGTISVTADGEININTTLTSSQANKLLAAAFGTANVKSIAIYSDKALIVETNNSSTPDDTFTMVANEPFTWNSSMLHANPFSENVTALYLTNGAASLATVQIRILVDATP